MANSTQQTMVEAIHKKYGDDDVGGGLIQIHIPTPATGKQESGQIAVPPILALHNHNISGAGDADKLKMICTKVQDLDLTENCLTDWDEVIKILHSLPSLGFLNLTGNKLENKSSWQCDAQFPSINNLVLNGTGVSWEMLIKLLHVFPRISELHLSLNDYSSVDIPEDIQYTALSKLYINSNKIQDWAVMCKLGRCLPNLHNFVTTESELSSMKSDVDMKQMFPSLRSLNVSNTKLSTWEDIDIFRDFPVLEDLRIENVSFLEELPKKERRQNILARLPNISKLNGSPVHEPEREEAERAFIRQFCDSEVKPNRCCELEAIHGKLHQLAEIDMAPIQAPITYYRIKVRYEDKEEIMDITQNQSVIDLKKSLENFCGIPAGKMIIYEYHKDIDSYNELNYNYRMLHSFRWTDNNELHVLDHEWPSYMDIPPITDYLLAPSTLFA